MEHSFTQTIREILRKHFGAFGDQAYRTSPLIQYLNFKTRSADRGSKSRGSFANLYAIYVLAEDYVMKGFADSGNYSNYSGAKYTDLLVRQRELPFGRKLQNHALNGRLNDEFRKYFPSCTYAPVLRDPTTNRYWINESLLAADTDGSRCNLAASILDIIDAYVLAKRDAFESFIEACRKIQDTHPNSEREVSAFVKSLVAPNVDARIFEIVSYAILKHFYSGQTLYWGWSLDSLKEEGLTLYKTGRTNANDGGIDFVMRPLGRFFQVTETTDVRKYFLDIDKVQRFPISFVIKSEATIEELTVELRRHASKHYGVVAVVERYMACIEEIITIPVLLKCFDDVLEAGKHRYVLDEIAQISRVEFDFQDSGEPSG